MNSFERAKNVFLKQGLPGALYKLYILGADRWFDLKYGIDTFRDEWVPGLTVASDNLHRGSQYQPSRIVPLRILFQRIKPLAPPESVLVDFGCGKGRVLLIAAERGIKQARGIEYARELCETAKRNCAEYRRRLKTDASFEIIESDVLDYKLRPDENIFFFYNPFDAFILNKILDHIEASLEQAPRKIMIVYLNPVCRDVIEHRPSFKTALDFRLLDYHFKVYENRL